MLVLGRPSFLVQAAPGIGMLSRKCRKIIFWFRSLSGWKGEGAWAARSGFSCLAGRG